jgi:predicted transcriptional regulator
MIPVGTDRAIVRGIEALQTASPDAPITVQALEDHTGYSDSTIRRATKRLLKLGVLCRRTEEGVRGFFYEVLNAH